MAQKKSMDFSKFLENLPDAFAYHQIVTDRKGAPVNYIFLEVNDVFEKMTGLSRKQVIGKKVTEVLPDIKQSAFDWIGTYGEVALEGKKISLQKYSESLDRWYDINAYSDARGYFTTIFRNITAWKRTSDAQSILLDNIQTQVWYLTDEHTYGAVNLAHAEFNGVNMEDMAFKNMYDIFPRETVEIFSRNNSPVFAVGSQVCSEEWVPNASGQQRLLAVTRTPKLRTDGTMEYVVCSAEDITKRRQAEEERKNLTEQLIRSEKLAAVGELIAGVAHEINNPLTGMIGLAELLTKDKNSDFDKETMKDMLDSLYQASLRIHKIVGNLLRFSRREAPMSRNISVCEIIDTVLNIRDYEMKSRNIKVEKNYRPDIPDVRVDPSQLEQVFLNLITNAEYAMLETGRGGTLSINVSLNGKPPERQEVVVEFADTGGGIPADVLPNLFNPFFTTKPVGKGTGLGLSVSYGIIKEHGGEIRAGNSKEGGAVFTITLPVGEEI